MRWALQHIDHPSEEPVTLQEAKAHLRVDGPEQDQWITKAIAAAREFCETFQGRAYITQRLALSLERWPCGRSIYLPRPPLQSVEAVTYTLADGTVQTFDSALYVVDTTAEPGAIHLRPQRLLAGRASRCWAPCEGGVHGWVWHRECGAPAGCAGDSAARRPLVREPGDRRCRHEQSRA